ncbi:MAG: phosphate propanoyltransferase [Verrucomicrobiales bacterium]|jgi:putative phosphotransacetylase|nr:phosphate propanoyltransferase [Verrucomicrobiales bacterium]
MTTDFPSRELVAGLVREALFKRLGRTAPRRPAPELVVNSSARHMHISPENLEILFGPGAKLEVHKWLYQEGQFASKQTVTLIGPRKRIIPNLRILGPCRNLTQVELAFTDAVSLGIDLPTRASGDIAGTPGAYIMGPKGFLEMRHGVIRAARHAHMSPADADFYGVKHLDLMKLRVLARHCTTVFDDLLVRVDQSFKLEVHIDTDEANACDLEHASQVELLK